MTDIGFYHLTRSPLERVLPKLLGKALATGARVVVMAGSSERVDVLDQMLWTYDAASFLPHGSARNGEAEVQPIWLTVDDENPNESSILILIDGASSERVAEYERCLEMFDGNDKAVVAAARARWGDYATAGHSLTYWQQTKGGGWEKKTD